MLKYLGAADYDANDDYDQSCRNICWAGPGLF